MPVGNMGESGVDHQTLHPDFIVGIGGSAGALSACKTLLDAMPSNIGMAFVIVSYISATVSSQLTEILSRHTKMPVLLASVAMPIRGNYVYVIPPSADLVIESYTFKVASPRAKSNEQIDSVFISLAEAMGDRAIGIVLSGYGSDGAEGCKYIKANGGRTFSQDISAETDEMPLNAQASGCVDFVLPPNRIPAELKGLVRTFAARERLDFDPKKFLATIGEGRSIVRASKKETIFMQGDTADAVFYIQTGKVLLSVLARNGKEAMIGILNAGDFCGENCMGGLPLRLGSATAFTDCELMRIEKESMMRALHHENALSDLFTAYLLGRNIRYEADVVDHLFSSSEKRLARTLLLLSHFGKEGVSESVVPKISQEVLAEMVGTTRSRVSFFMNRFRKLGFIDYDAANGLKINSSLLNVVLHD